MNQKQIMDSMLEFWHQDKTFEKSISTRDENLNFVFYDGPPFASGDPHYGHLLSSAIKDLIPRYMTLRGHRVYRTWGWDCHGLPAENFVEKQLGVSGRKEIEEKIGVQAFVEACRNAVMQINENRKRFVDNLGRWVDMDRAYFTMDIEFMESVVNVFSTMYSKNLIYKSFKVQGYCPKCATPLSNHEISEGYADKQDPGVTFKLPIVGVPRASYSQTSDNFVDVVCGMIKYQDGIIMLEHSEDKSWKFPGGKVDAGESLEDALSREIQEELGITIFGVKKIGSTKYIGNGKTFLLHYFEATSDQEPKIQEDDKHSSYKLVKKIDEKFFLGDEEITQKMLENELRDFYLVDNFFPKVEESKAQNARVYILPWTTTPWTLPSNMFAAVGEDIDYSMIFDITSECYYILANQALKKYYKNPSDYVLVWNIKGDDLIGLKYEPLFDYITQDKSIPQSYKDKFFQVLKADFVSTSEGSGIVHQAPAFGAEDYELVANFLGRQHATSWLFMPINEFGEYTVSVKDYEGIRVYDANSQILEKLKSQNRIVKVESITHSYPHCRRCDTPLIYRAIDSWFVNEQKIKSQLVSQSEDLNFVPTSIKKRFSNILSSAPDWNISRNRFWGAPLPIWEKISSTKNNSNGILAIKNASSEEEKKSDSYGKKSLNENGTLEAQKISSQLLEKIKTDFGFENVILIHGIMADSTHPLISGLRKSFKNMGLKVYSPDMPNSSKPTYQQWEEYIDQNYSHLFGEKTLLIAHSLGAVFAGKYLSQKNLKLGGLVFIAPATPNIDIKDALLLGEKDDNQEMIQNSLDFISNANYESKNLNNIAKKLIVVSQDDQYIDQNAVKDFFKNENILTLDGHKHFGNPASSYEVFWEILNNFVGGVDIYLAPTKRSFQTLQPFFDQIFGPISEILEKNFAQVVSGYQQLWTYRKLETYIKNGENIVLDIFPHVFVDLKLADKIDYEFQDKEYPENFERENSGFEGVEKNEDINFRLEKFLENINQTGKTDIIVAGEEILTNLASKLDNSKQIFFDSGEIVDFSSLKNGNERIVIANLNELYELTKTGSKNITKFTFIRHAHSQHNIEGINDIKGTSLLTDKGQTQAENLAENFDIENKIVFVSPLKRTFQTLLPSIKKTYPEKISDIEKNYEKVVAKWNDLYERGVILDYLNSNNTQKYFSIFEDKIFVDFRLCETFLPDTQGVKLAEIRENILSNLRNGDLEKNMSEKGESFQNLFDRTQNFLQQIGKEFCTENIVVVSHKRPIQAMEVYMLRKKKESFEFIDIKNCQPVERYFDTSYNQPADLHKPYIDGYYFEIEGSKYQRVPEVLDCWYESGSMPFGQYHFPFEKDKKFGYPAQFIAEGLDQTRGWFRSLHVVGNSVTGENSFKNAIVNGMILAQDGKKMSKKLKNYPDPKYLLDKYGSDAFRLYVLGSPVVRAEAFRFNENGVDQMLKDFILPLHSIYNFLSTYSQADGFVSKNTNIFFQRHINAIGQSFDAPISPEGETQLQSESFRENVVRTNADIIFVSSSNRTLKTAEKVQEILKENGKQVEVFVQQMFEMHGESFGKFFEQKIKENEGKNILFIGHQFNFHGIDEKFKNSKLKNGEIIKIHNFNTSNELDSWIIGETNNLIFKLDQHLGNYILDGGVKELINFVDKLSNWYIRRSRRRFWSEGMDSDKLNAYNTLLYVFETLLQVSSVYIPFNSEYLWKKLQNINGKTGSIHLSYWPLASEIYIDEKLSSEIEKVRTIISLSNYIRAKNKVKIKQPLSNMKVHL